MRSRTSGIRLGRRNGWFYAVWSDPIKGTQRFALRTQDRQDAERQLADFQIKSAADRTLVSEIMDAYLIDRDQTAANPVRIRDAWKRLKPHFGHLRPDQVNRVLCRSYCVRRTKDGVGEGTIRTELQYLRAGLRFANPNTPAIIEMPKKPAPRDKRLTKEQFALLVDATKHHHMKVYLWLARMTAARPGAILELRWTQIDWERGRITLGDGTKRKKGRPTVPMHSDALIELLRETQKGALTDYVVEYAGGPIKSIKKGFATAAEKAGIPWATPYALRHSAAVWMAEEGVPMAEISQFMGHSDSRVTESTYARFSPEYLRRAAKALQ